MAIKAATILAFLFACVPGWSQGTQIDWTRIKNPPAVTSLIPSGNGTKAVTTTGVQTLGSCVVVDAFGNHVPSGFPCISSIRTGSTTISPGTVKDGACNVGGTTITVSGAVVGDAVNVAPSTPLPAGINVSAQVAVANTISVQLCNWSGSPVTLPTATYTATVLH